MSEILTGIFLILGSFIVLLAGLGVVKMPDIYTRMSATSKATWWMPSPRFSMRMTSAPCSASMAAQ